jgi:dTDP-4-amino-4,6-dideoxygalactose transaminase
LHQDYTDHTERHSDRIIRLLNQLVETAGLKKSLNKWEIYILLAAAYVHDLGMQNQRFKDGELEKIRTDHHIEEALRPMLAQVRIHPDVFEIVLSVAVGHRKVDLSTKLYDKFLFTTEEIRPRLLAALLRIADELDITHERVDIEVLNSRQLNPESWFYWYRCHYVSGISIEKGVIRIQCRFPEGKQHYRLLVGGSILQEIENTLEEVDDILRDEEVYLSLPRSEPQSRYEKNLEEMPAQVLAYSQEMYEKTEIHDYRRLLSVQYRFAEEQIDLLIAQTLHKGVYLQASNNDRFEKEFARFCQVEHGIGVRSGTEGLRLALLACEVGPEDEVIVPDFGPPYTALAVSQIGATPVFVDVDSTYFTLDPSRLEAAISDNVKAIIPVHLYGQCVDMEPVTRFAQEHNLKVIEDACPAPGATYYDRFAGSLGDIGVFSFYPTKNLGGLGDGGMAVTNDAELARRLRYLTSLGEDETDRFSIVAYGFSSRLDELTASYLRRGLKRLKDWNEKRREYAALYSQELADLPGLILPTERSGNLHVYHLYVVQFEKRNLLIKKLKSRGVPTSINYPLPVHCQRLYVEPAWCPYFVKNNHRVVGNLPITTCLVGRILSLPLHQGYNEEEINRFAKITRQAILELL